MKQILGLAFALLLVVGGLFAETEEQKRLTESADVLAALMQGGDQAIPQDLLDRAECVVVIPSMVKGAFIVGGQYGRGFVSCRKSSGTGWSAPGAVRLEGGSVGFQIGGQATDIILLVMNKLGAKKMLTSKFTLGGEASVAAGPVGRTTTAETDALLRAEILSWSRSRGVFAGISLKGSTLREDNSTIEALYGKKYRNRDIITSGLAVPAAAKPLIAELNKYSSRRSK
ncbi:MAG: lipid-binding SYLF domain-containing protein [Bryobacterales bacterium]|nr:lipid-binding SYLF domain-containing protein [Bryobacterales bacterium]